MYTNMQTTHNWQSQYENEVLEIERPFIENLRFDFYKVEMNNLPNKLN